MDNQPAGNDQSPLSPSSSTPNPSLSPNSIDPTPPTEPVVPSQPSITSPVTSSPGKKSNTILWLVIIVVLLAGILGTYYWQHKKVNSLTTQVTALNLQVTKLNAQVKKLSTSTSSTKTTSSSTNPYAGWGTSCDSSSKSCFYYPSGWATSAGTNNQGLNIDNSSSGAAILVDPSTSSCSPTATAPETAQFYVSSINSVTTSSLSLDVLGGYYTNTLNGKTVYNPYYQLADKSVVSKYGLKVGSAATFPYAWACLAYGSNNLGDATAEPTASTVNSTTQSALVWLSTSGAKTAMQILQSVYTQK